MQVGCRSGILNPSRQQRRVQPLDLVAGNRVAALSVAEAAFDDLGDQCRIPAGTAVQHAFKQPADGRLFAAAPPIPSQPKFSRDARERQSLVAIRVRLSWQEIVEALPRSSSTRPCSKRWSLGCPQGSPSSCKGWVLYRLVRDPGEANALIEPARRRIAISDVARGPGASRVIWGILASAGHFFANHPAATRFRSRSPPQ